MARRRSVAFFFWLPVAMAEIPFLCALAHAQKVGADTKAETPQFEVASIRPNRSSDLVRSIHFTPDGLVIEGFPLRDILAVAFLPEHGSSDDQLLGLPGWARSERFDIRARVSDRDVPRWQKLPMTEQKKALQALLTDRFHLHYHHEPRKGASYVLSIAKGGPRLVEADARPHMFLPLETGHLESHSTYMWQLTQALQDQLGYSVIDKTGLHGTYNYKLQWTPENEPSSDSPWPSLATALKEQLGLKLDLQKGPVDVIVIDHIEQPTPN